MRRWSDRGQVEPLAALAAVLAVVAGLTIYAGTLDDRVPESPDRETASTTLDTVRRALQTAGVVDPDRFDRALATVPDGWRANVSLDASGRQWSRGPVPPETADSATVRVSVRLEPAEIRPGRLRVAVWR